MRVVLADLAAAEGLVSKDTVAGGYGSRLMPFSRVTRVYCHYKKRRLAQPSIQLGYVAAILARHGHEVVFTKDEVPEGDAAIVLSSLVDYRRETCWADEARRRGLRVGFIGLAASKLPSLFEDHADFLIQGEPETAVTRLALGQPLTGAVPSPPVNDLDSLPFPRWDLLTARKRGLWTPASLKIPVLSSRGCPEFCTYCPHRILAPFRARSVRNVADELEYLCEEVRFPFVVFRDALFTENRERCLALCDEIQARGLRLRFACETRLDSLDPPLLKALRQAGLSAVSFGVETVSPATLRRAGRRPIPEAHQRLVVDTCHRLGVITIAYYVLGFLQDTWDSIAATIDYSISLATTFAQFKLMTPYPGTPMWRQFEPLVMEKDWQKFDGYTVTFRHPNLTPDELRFLLGAAYARFYARPGFLVNYYRLRDFVSLALLERLDRRVLGWHARKEMRLVSRAVEC
jgi:anaerobic magnesium-protoporphyrin IX monomethyl ester cyclase